MKKVFFLLSLIPLLFASCDSNPTMTINGTIKNNNLDGQKIYFYTLEIDSIHVKGPTLRDSIEISSGKFTLKEEFADSPSLGLIGLGIGQETVNPENPADIFIILEPGTINITLDGQRVSVEGTAKNNDLNKALYSLMNETIDMRDEVTKAGGVEAVPLDGNGKDVVTRMKNKSKELEKGLFGFVKDNMTNSVGEVLFTSFGNSFKRDQQLELIAISDTSFQNREFVKQIKEFIDFQKEKEAAIIGTHYKDITLLNKKEVKESLSKHIGKGKYVFIDFWATWCRPCLEEMPALMAVQEKYNDKDFEIVGISLDQEKDTWLQALTIMGLPWTQLFDVDKIAGSTYEISAIPYTLLIDKEGKIIAMELSADDLDDKLEELLN